MSIDLFQVILKLQGYPLTKAIKNIDAINKLDRQKFLAWQQQQCKEIVAYHYKNNPFYKKFIGTLPEKWEDLPVLNKKDYQRPLPELLSKGFSNKNIYRSNTSGSSGHPFYFAKDKYCHALTWALIKQRYSEYNISLKDTQARFYGIPLNGKSAKIERWKDKFMDRVRFPVFDLSNTQLNRYIDSFKKNPFIYIYGYTNAIRHFAMYLIQEGILLKDICPSLQTVIVTSEMCSPADKQVIEKGTGVPVYIEYGASEVGIIAIEDLRGRMKVSEELLHTEVNESGELLVTSFFNKAFPMIRYNIGDVVSLKSDSEGLFCQSIQGRSDDMVKLPSGKSAAGMTLYYCSREILEQFGKIKELYVTQKSLDCFIINYFAEKDLMIDDINLISEVFKKYLEPGLKLQFQKTDTIRRKKNGKFQIFNSEL